MDEFRFFQLCTPWLLLTSVVTAFGSSMLMGYNIAVLNAPTKIIINFYNETYRQYRDVAMSDDHLHILWASTVSVFVCAGMIGAFSCGIVADFFGRKKGLLFNHGFMFIGALLEGMAQPFQYPEMLIIGRAFVGINCGMSVGLASLYLTELPPKQIRGAIGSFHQLAATFGILLAQIIGIKEILGTEEGWPYLLALSAAPALISTLILPFCPESPRFLLLKKQNCSEATKALKVLRGKSDVQSELDEMSREAKELSRRGQKFKTIQLFTKKELVRPLLIAIVIQVAQQWSGINAIFYYSESIFEGAGVSADHIPYAIIGTGAINLTITLNSVYLVERLGRRTLLLGPMCLMALSTIVITISLNMQATYSWMAYISIACIIVFITGFALGLGSIPPLICSELFRQEPRSAAMAVAQGVNWTCNFILAMSFKFIQNALQTHTFLVFLVILLLCIIFIYFNVPETKNRTFDEIARDMDISRLGQLKRSVSRYSTRSTARLLNFRSSFRQSASAGNTPFASPAATPATTPMSEFVDLSRLA